MKHSAEQVLKRGLSSGYAGGGVRSEVSRGPFTLKATELTFPDVSGAYNDHWIAKRVGGGQEIARSGEAMATRVFAGGIAKPEILVPLGINEGDVLTYLKGKLSVLAESTRLHDEVIPEADRDWQYAYRPLTEFSEIPVSVGVESVTYKGTTVFVHVFVVAPIE